MPDIPDIFNGFYKDKRILITGHTGFKGAWLSIWLHRLGAKMIGYALPPPTTPSIYEICSLGKLMTSVIGDVRDSKSLQDVVSDFNPDIVFHLAAQSLVRYSYKEPVETYQTNIMGTVNLFESCKKAGSVRAIVNITSDKCYENNNRVYSFKETDPLGGYDPYSSSKACAELVTSAYIRSYFNPKEYRRHRLALASARAGNAVGGGDWSQDRIVPDCIKALLAGRPIIVRNPESVRPWQHVLEPLYGYLLLARHLYEDGPEFSGAWNFGPDVENIKTVRWLVERITKTWEGATSWQSDTIDNPHEFKYLRLDCTKAKSMLSWYPIWSIETTVEKTLQWYKAYSKKDDILGVTTGQIEAYLKSVKGNRYDGLQVLQ